MREALIFTVLTAPVAVSGRVPQSSSRTGDGISSAMNGAAGAEKQHGGS